jgi:peptidoglycan/LPS O-acetylase OafA/YrhL
MGKKQNRALNVVRATAAILVVMEHVRAMFFADWSEVDHTAFNRVFYFLTGLGSSAVMVFFVLSGYLVGNGVVRGVRRGTFSWRQYLLNRVSRLWAALVPAVVIATLIGWLCVWFFSETDVVQGASGYHNVVGPEFVHTLGLTTVLGNFAFLQGIVVPVLGTNGPLWSLAYEFWYYILFPLLATVLYPGKTRTRLISVVLFIALAAFAGPAILELFPIWLLGVGVALVSPRVMGSMAGAKPIVVLLTRAAAVSVLAGSFLARELGLLGAFGPFVVGLAASVLVATLLTDAPMLGVVWSPLRGLASYAAASYSLYVIHMPLTILAAILIVPSIDGRFAPSVQSLLGFIFIVTVLIAAGGGFYFLFERRTEWLRSRLDSVTSGRARRRFASTPAERPVTKPHREAPRT